VKIILVILITAFVAWPQASAKRPVARDSVQQGVSAMPVTGPAQLQADSLPVPDSLIIESLDFKDADIRDVLRGLGVQYGINIWMSPEVKGRIPIHFSNIKLRDAISFIINKYGFEYRVRRGIVEVYQPEAVVAAAQLNITVKDSLMSIDVKDAEVEDVVRKIAGLSRLNIIIDKNSKGQVTGILQDIETKKGLKVLMESNGFEVTEANNVIYVSKQAWDPSGKAQKPSRTTLSIIVKDSLVSIEVTNVSIATIINEIASQSRLNLVVYVECQGTISAKFSNIYIDDALQYILRNTQYTFWKSKGIYFVGQNTMQDMENKELIRLNNLKADEVVELLPKTVAAKATLKVIKEHNAIMVIGPYDIITAAKDYIALIDQPVPQILIEAMVVDFSISKMRELGVSLFLGDSSTGKRGQTYFPVLNRDVGKQGVDKGVNKLLDAFGVKEVVSLPKNFIAQIKALENEGVADIVSTPQIATLNGNTASITISKTFYYRIESTNIITGTGNIGQTKTSEVKSIDTKISLSVTPWVTASREVTVEIKPVFQIPGTQPDVYTPPNVDTRELTSTIRLKDGETYILGGLIQNVQSDNIKKVPFLGDIPLLGRLFRTKSTSLQKSQLMIFLTPHVYFGDEGSVDKDKYMNDMNKMKKKWWE